MTTTVTTATITTVTSMGLTAALGLVTTLGLLALLLTKEVAVAARAEREVQWGRNLSVGMVPLLIAFAVIVATKLASAL